MALMVTATAICETGEQPGLSAVKECFPKDGLVGDPINVSVQVTNTGDVPLTDVTVQDNHAGLLIYDSGDTNGNGELDPAETWIYTGSYDPGAPGSFTNQAEVKATAPDGTVITIPNNTDTCQREGAPGKLTISKEKRLKKWDEVEQFPWPNGPSYFYPDVDFRVCDGDVSDAGCGGDKLVTTLTITGPAPVSVELPAGTYTVCEDEPVAPFSGGAVDVVEGGSCKTAVIEPGEETNLAFVNCHPTQAYL